MVNPLHLRLKQLIIDALMMEDLTPEDIQDATPLFGDDGLGLDSVDALALVIEIERTFGVTIPDDASSRSIMASVTSLAEHLNKTTTI